MSAASHIPERERAEAASVSAHGDGHQFEIQLGHLCNNRCVFCYSGQLTEMKLARHIPLDPMLAALEEARASGARRVTFLGGEPTLHKGLLPALRRAVELGFAEIVIFTNGVMLPHPGFIDKVVALGNFEWRISIQGATEEAHVAVTGRPDSFRRIVEGLKMLRERGQKVTANMCVNERSYRSLPAYPAFVREHGVRQLHVDIVRPSDTGERSEEYLRDIMPRYSDMAPYMAEMLAGFDADFDVSLGNLPLCILPAWAQRIHHGGEETITQAAHRSGFELSVYKYEYQASMRQHVRKCEGCAFRPRCTGIFRGYLDLYGDGEFQPVTRETLQANPSRHFEVLAQPFLEPLEIAAPPEGWRLASWKRNERNQCIDVRYACTPRGEVTLQFLPAPEQGDDDAHLTTTEYRMNVLGGESGEEELVRLLTWVSDRLREGPATIVRPLDVRRVLAERRRARLLALGQERLEELVRRVVKHERFGAWQVAGSYEADGTRIVELDGPESGRLELLFLIREQASHPRIALDARPGSGVPAAVARSVVRDIVQAIGS